jgi:hypothetical protein
MEPIYDLVGGESDAGGTFADWSNLVKTEVAAGGFYVERANTA